VKASGQIRRSEGGAGKFETTAWGGERSVLPVKTSGPTWREQEISRKGKTGWEEKRGRGEEVGKIAPKKQNAAEKCNQPFMKGVTKKQTRYP